MTVRRVTIASVAELQAVLDTAGDDALYRGQVKHYGSLHAPALSTSFSRHGCDPANMPKWLHYASMSLSALVPGLQQSGDIEFTQAILQHYGWRSWFLDASADPAVSAWFASHAYADRIGIDMREDCFEDWVWLRRRHARYEASQGDGHLYVLSKAKLREEGLRAVDLASISLPNRRPRFHAQSAWLVGPLRDKLPIAAVAAHVIGPAAVFCEYAESRGVDALERVFPTAAEDPVLATLLDLPWERIRLPASDDPRSNFEVPAYHRQLELPEYFTEGYRKILPPHFSFYDGGTSIADGLASNENVHVVPVREIAMYGHADVTMRFPGVTAMLTTNPHVAFEVDTLIRLPESGAAHHYSKGLSVRRVSDGVIAVGDLVVDHPGKRLAGIAVNYGWHYVADEAGTWTRVLHQDDCPCPNAWRHQQHLSALTIIEAILNERAGGGVSTNHAPPR